MLNAFDHTAWDKLLRENITVINGGQVTQVDYDGFLDQRSELQEYLMNLSEIQKVDFDGWGEGTRLAFLINAYNAWTIELVLTRYPNLRSIRQIGLLPISAWRKDIVELFDTKYSLDEVEHGMIRAEGIYNEPRIHFAVNCAAIGCPALRPEAFVGEKLEEQLEESTKLFLADKTRNYSDGGKLYISSVFDWYGEDFEKGWQGLNSVAQFLYLYAEELRLDEEMKEKLFTNQLELHYLKYDWNLNRTAPL
tara:strand:+ start:3268 stop:4017 length:750 start_codon:yes stop_codon:yes gene_type:complete